MASAEGKKLASTRGSKEGKQLKVGPDLCTACDTGDHAESYCQECADYLCAECTKSHKRQRRTKQHILMDLNLTKSMKAHNYNRCPKHSDNFVDKFCEKCNDVVCDVCVAEKHKGHKVSSISDCAEKVFNLCLDKSKQLQGPFNKMKAAKKNVERKKISFIDNCNSTEDEIKQRKDKLITLITEVADAEIDRVKSTKTKVESLCVLTVDKLESVLKDCETVATPLVMGTNINNIVKRILFISAEIEEAITVLPAADELEQISNTKLGTDIIFSDIKGKANQYLRMNDIDIPTLHRKATVQKGKTEIDRPDTTSEKDASIKIAAAGMSKSTKVRGLPSQLLLVNKSKTGVSRQISKHITPESFISQHHTSGPINHVSYNNDTGFLPSTLPYEPKPKHKFGRSILTISYDRHVIVSAKALHLCNNSNVICSEPHSADGYIPDMLAYYSQQKFVTLCNDQEKIRYYDTKTLKTLETCSLQSSAHIRSNSVLCTSNGDILLETSSSKLKIFTQDGVMKAVVPIHQDYFKCMKQTQCIDQYDTLFGVSNMDLSIHVFDLEGGHRILDELDIIHLWSAGVDSDQNLYVSYCSETDRNIIAKYKYF